VPMRAGSAGSQSQRAKNKSIAGVAALLSGAPGAADLVHVAVKDSSIGSIGPTVARAMGPGVEREPQKSCGSHRSGLSRLLNDHGLVNWRHPGPLLMQELR